MCKVKLVRWFGRLCICIPTTLGCSSSNSQATLPEAQTLVGIEATDFVAEGTCGTQLQSYVATLFDDTGPAGISDAGVSSGRFLVAISAARSCDQATVFSNVIASHAYDVELQGYKQRASDLYSAYISANSGSSAMLLRSDSSYVAPQWTASCHGWTDDEGNAHPGYAYLNVTVTLRECTKFGAATH